MSAPDKERPDARDGRYLPQLLAAIRRCRLVDEHGGPIWGCLPSVYVAYDAYYGDEEMRRELDESPAWQIGADGELP